ncbi:MAG: hypothetical protein KGP28_00670 [Bdellovibrionales bacterium]|nr:hypothetical protein [Bdellovibrionales bacterium]
MKHTKAIPLILIALTLSACGRGLDTYHSAGLQQAGLLDGVLTIPNSGVSSGRSFINTELSGFYIDLEESDPEAISYLNRLESREISVARTPLSNSTLYSVRFSGVWGDGPCPFDGALTCSKIKLRELVAY